MSMSARARTPPVRDAQGVESSNYVGVAGSGTIRAKWTLDEAVFGPVYIDGVLYFGELVRAGDITDGLSNTLTVGERSYFNTNAEWSFGAVWADYYRRGEPTQINVGAAKNFVWPINTIENRRAFFLKDFNAPPELRKIYQNDLPFGSRHPGGAAFGLADGSVHFFSEDTDLSILRELASRNGGENNRWVP